MTDPLADLVVLMQSAMRDAVIHRAYLHAALAGDLAGPDGTLLAPAGEETARAMVVAYIGAQRPAHVQIDLPPDAGDDWA